MSFLYICIKMSISSLSQTKPGTLIVKSTAQKFSATINSDVTLKLTPLHMTEKRPRVLQIIVNYFIAMIVCLSRIW
jgi:hypothetical protein